VKAILLAAGKGSRISKDIESVPKSTLLIGEVPLIRRNVELLIERNIEPIVCVGYKKEKIFEALEGLDVTYYYNPFYNITNSIASLWFAKCEFNEEVLIMNADVYFTEKILDSVIKDKSESVLLIDKSKTKEGDFFLKLEDGVISKYGKDLPLEDRSCEYVGIGKVKESFLDEFKEKLDFLIDNKEYDLWWENVLYSLIDSNKVSILDVNDEFWCEIDCIKDYEKILGYINKSKEQICSI